MITPDSSRTATFETHTSMIARNESSGELLPSPEIRLIIFSATPENILGSNLNSSLCNLCVLCASVVVLPIDPLTTETQRTPRLHREANHGLLRCEVAFAFESTLRVLKTVMAPLRTAKSFDSR